MRQEKSSNILQQKLEELNRLPNDIEFDSSSAWNKLEGRLHPVTKKNTLGYYLIAASVLALIFTLLIQKDNKNVSAKEVAVQKKPAAKVEKTSTADLIESRQSLKIRTEMKPKQNGPLIAATEPVLNKTPDDLKPHIGENLATDLLSVIPNMDEEKAATKPPENIVAKTPVRKFRIVHNNETLTQPQYPGVAKRSTSSNTGFPLFKPNQAMDVNSEEPAQEEILPQQRKKDRGFIKLLSNTLKED
jgi:hypothetical protein